MIPVTANGRAAVLIVRDGADFALLTIGGSQPEIDRILWVMNPVKLASIALAAQTAHEPSTRDACSRSVAGGAHGAAHHWCESSFTGVRMGAPLAFSSTTTNLAGSVLLALRPTT